MLKNNFTTAPNVKIMINLGCLLDIPTGSFIKGIHGQNILLGGLGYLTGITGIGNSFKSTIMHYMTLSAASKMYHIIPTNIITYDTEINIHEHHLKQFTAKFPELKDRDIISEGDWVITDKTIYFANKWYKELQGYLKDKRENTKGITFTTPFLSRDKKTPLKILLPTFGQIDSFSEFETEDVAKMQNDNELGESGGNTIFMRQGLSKARFMSEIPILSASTYHYMFLAAHMGKEVQMASGPFAPPPVKKLHSLKHGDKIKGVTDKFTFLMNNCWYSSNAKPLLNQSTRAPEYPRTPDDNIVNDNDLNIVTICQLRGKSGATGITIDILVSQSEGVLPSLTEFHFIKDKGRFGLSGSLQSYSLDLYPDVKVSRTTIRSKIDNDYKLRRAINITAELLQMKYYHRHLHNIMCTPAELYEKLTKLGYDMNVLLSTRGWWTIEDDKHPIPFLSTMDLLLMAREEYFPYWMNPDKTINQKFFKGE